MSREFYIGYIEYFFITTDWGLLWLSVVVTGIILKGVNNEWRYKGNIRIN